MGATLIERESELRRLDSLLRDVVGGSGRIAVIEGPPGIGKTQLVAAARDLAEQQGVSWQLARGGEHEHEAPFGVVRELFEGQLLAADDATWHTLFTGAAALASPVFDHAPGGQPAAGQDDPAAVIYGLYWLCVKLALRRPLALAVDDVHWADAPSLRWLEYLGRRVEELPIFLLLTVRAGERRPSGLEAIAALPEAAVILPKALSEAGSSTFIERRIPVALNPRFASSCYGLTRGNPLLLKVLLDVIDEQEIDPTSDAVEDLEELSVEQIARVVLPRLARLGASAEKLARAVAVLGPDAMLRDAAALARLSVTDAGRVADSLAAVGVFEEGRPLSFVHPVVRAAVYSELGCAGRSELHKQAAEQLARVGAPAADSARHLLFVEPAGRASVVRRLRAAGAGALARGAPEVAAVFLRRAITEPPGPPERPAILAELGAAAARAGEDQAVEWLASAFETAREPTLVAGAALELATALIHRGEPGAALEALQRALPRLHGKRELSLQVEGVLLAAAGLERATSAIATERAARLARLDLAGSTAGEWVVLAALALETLKANAPAERAAMLAERALAEGRLLDDVAPEAAPLGFSIAVLTFCDRFDEAIAACDGAIMRARQRGSATAFGVASLMRAQAEFRRGAVRDAEADSANAVKVLSEDALLSSGALSFLVDVLCELGRLQAAEEALAAQALTTTVPEESMGDWLLASRGRLRMLQGRHAEALDDLLLCGRRQEDWAFRCPAAVPWRSGAALAHRALGERQEAERLAREEVELAQTFGARRAIGISLRALALVQGGEQSIARLSEAEQILAMSPARLEHARVLCDLGAAMRRSRQVVRSRESLRRALDAAVRLGATALADRARDELRATGARPRRVLLNGYDALTASERRVATLAMEGMTNNEIAEALFVTPKTVEAHLAHTYRKLNVRSRTELAGALPATSSSARG